jgi:hypothetical protein
MTAQALAGNGDTCVRRTDAARTVLLSQQSIESAARAMML